MLAKAPGLDIAGSSWDEPDGQMDPALHGRHDDAPVSFCNVAAGKGPHVALPVTDAWLPGMHGDGAIEPVPHEWPSVQSVHCSACADAHADAHVHAHDHAHAYAHAHNPRP